MARITVDDCLEHMGNRFDLILAASKRAHTLANHGADALVDQRNDKPTVIALREIAADLVDSKGKSKIVRTIEDEFSEADEQS